jgi:hypothetical protein
VETILQGIKATTKGRQPKLKICEEIVALFKQKIIVVGRSAKQILDKIILIEKSFKLAHDWINNTGQGVDNQEQFREAVMKQCLYYYELEEKAMGEKLQIGHC